VGSRAGLDTAVKGTKLQIGYDDGETRKSTEPFTEVTSAERLDEVKINGIVQDLTVCVTELSEYQVHGIYRRQYADDIRTRAGPVLCCCYINRLSKPISVATARKERSLDTCSFGYTTTLYQLPNLHYAALNGMREWLCLLKRKGLGRKRPWYVNMSSRDSLGVIET
jgi:hypothetical protein